MTLEQLDKHLEAGRRVLVRHEVMGVERTTLVVDRVEWHSRAGLQVRYWTRDTANPLSDWPGETVQVVPSRMRVWLHYGRAWVEGDPAQAHPDDPDAA